MGPFGSLRSATERPSGTAILRAPLLEVFASIQGEGLYAGRPQVLLRLAGCPLRCRWCDTPQSWPVPAADHAGGEWSSPFDAVTRIAAVDPGGRRTVSVTGGEPLLWPAFLRELSTLLGPRRLHLETAGAHPDVLEVLLDIVDHVSLDLKLPADLDDPVSVEGAPPGPAVPRDEHEWAEVRARNLVLVRDRDACAKIVFAGGTAPEALAPLLDDVADLNRELPVFLQPATPVRGVDAPSPALLEALVAMAEERELDVRVVPQLHPWLGLR